MKLNDNIDTIAWLRNKTSVELVELVKSSNPQVVADYAAGLITVLNQVERILKKFFLVINDYTQQKLKFLEKDEKRFCR